MDPLQFLATQDGSHTLFHPQLHETYHSTKGALTESEHVFIREGLRYYGERHAAGPLSVLEVGFGTGLNALLTWREARESGRAVRYVTLEPFPLPEPIWRGLNYWASLGMEAEGHRLHEAPWGQEAALSENFCLEKLACRLEDYGAGSARFEVVYFDAFAPQKQPELWTPELLGKCFEALVPGGVLTTYCAQGQFKRDLRAAGFSVARVEGPPGGKREMTRAVKPG
jgi:tRNA U34 5-methylaminomethyl-2-thiouridine-forming methyltransferase MnmC